MNRLRALWSNLRVSLWFIPSLLVTVAVLGALFFVRLSATLGEELVNRWPSLFGAGADGARGVLATIASSMITTAGVVFSITIVALSLASTQYTSRLLRNFMRDRTNQTVLGVFVGVFAYCLIVLRTIRAGDYAFVPSLAVFVAVILAFVGIGYFIYFIHHIARSIQASHVLSTVAHEAMDIVDHLYPEPIGEEAASPTRSIDSVTREQDWHLIPATRSGYIQWIDGDELLEIATRLDRVIWLQPRVGDFVATDTPLCALSGAEQPHRELARELNSCFTLSSQRSIDQDVSFGLRQITDVALKALSPGINDTTTAVMCINWATAIFVQLVQRAAVSPFRESDDGVLRVIAPGRTFEDIFEDTFSEIRQNASANATILLALIGGMKQILGVSRQAERQSVILRELDHVMAVAKDTIRLGADVKKICDFGTSVAALYGVSSHDTSAKDT